MPFHKATVTFKVTAVNPHEKPGYHRVKMLLEDTAAGDYPDLFAEFATSAEQYKTALVQAVEGNVAVLSVSIDDPFVTAASGNEYPSTKANMKASVVQNNGASAVSDSFKIPAPAAGMFNADGTVNLTHAGIVALGGVLDDTVTDGVDTVARFPISDDQLWSSWIGGRRA